MKHKTVYYRGLLRSCNYTCAYCSFHASRQRNISKSNAADEVALIRFCDTITQTGDDLTVVLTPHGEAMIHEHYHRAIKTLCTCGTIRGVCCQTNLSFDVDRFMENVGIQEMKEANATNRAKISLWCSFHPSQTELRDFLRQCEKLSAYGIRYCVGAVGHPGYLSVLKELRTLLPRDIYMWINALEGFGRGYTDTELAAFTEIDPLFELETRDLPADEALCTAGCGSIFTEANGDYFACHISKVKLGNLYSDGLHSDGLYSGGLHSGETAVPKKICRAKKCSCWLAYSNRVEIQELFLNTKTIPLRSPCTQKAVFFDVDGTLTDETGTIPDENIAAVKKMSETHLIFLATSLPFEYAKKTCARIWGYLSGGAFAEGSDMRIFDCGYRKIVPLDENAFCILPRDCRYETYRHGGSLHKIAVTSGTVPDSGDFHIVFDEVTGIVSKDAGKLNGVLHLCEKLNLLSRNVTVVGNGENDIPLLRYFRNSFAVPEAGGAVQKSAKAVLSVIQITLLRN